MTYTADWAWLGLRPAVMVAGADRAGTALSCVGLGRPSEEFITSVSAAESSSIIRRRRRQQMPERWERIGLASLVTHTLITASAVCLSVCLCLSVAVPASACFGLEKWVTNTGSSGNLESLPKPTAVAGVRFYLRLSVCLFFRTISQKPITKLDVEMFQDESCKPFILGSKGQGHESQKHCRRGSLHSCECWRLLVDLLCSIVGQNVSVNSSCFFLITFGLLYVT